MKWFLTFHGDTEKHNKYKKKSYGLIHRSAKLYQLKLETLFKPKSPTFSKRTFPLKQPFWFARLMFHILLFLKQTSNSPTPQLHWWILRLIFSVITSSFVRILLHCNSYLTRYYRLTEDSLKAWNFKCQNIVLVYLNLYLYLCTKT